MSLIHVSDEAICIIDGFAIHVDEYYGHYSLLYPFDPGAYHMCNPANVWIAHLYFTPSIVKMLCQNQTCHFT